MCFQPQLIELSHCTIKFEPCSCVTHTHTHTHTRASACAQRFRAKQISLDGDSKRRTKRPHGRYSEIREMSHTIDMSVH